MNCNCSCSNKTQKSTEHSVMTHAEIDIETDAVYDPEKQTVTVVITRWSSNRTKKTGMKIVVPLEDLAVVPKNEDYPIFEREELSAHAILD